MFSVYLTPDSVFHFTYIVFNSQRILIDTNLQMVPNLKLVNLLLGKEYHLYLVKLSLNIEFWYFPRLWINGRILSKSWAAKQTTDPWEPQDADVLWYHVLLSPGIC